MVYYYELNERVGEVFKSEWKPDQQQPDNPQLIIDGGVCASSNTRFCLGICLESIFEDDLLDQV